MPFAPLMRSLPSGSLEPVAAPAAVDPVVAAPSVDPVSLRGAGDPVAAAVPTIRFAAACSPANTTRAARELIARSPERSLILPPMASCLARSTIPASFESNGPTCDRRRPARTRPATHAAWTSVRGRWAAWPSLACVRDSLHPRVRRQARGIAGPRGAAAQAPGHCGFGRGARHRRGRRPAAGAGRFALLGRPRILDSGTRPGPDPGIAPSAALGVRRELAGLLLSTAPEPSALRRRPAFRWRAVPGRVDALQHRPADRAHGARRSNHRSPGGVLGRGGAQAARDTGWAGGFTPTTGRRP